MLASGYNPSVMITSEQKGGQTIAGYEAEKTRVLREATSRNRIYALFAVAGSVLVTEGVVNNGPADIVAGLATLAIVGALYYKNTEANNNRLETIDIAIEEIEDITDF